jgi:hypothetical protein
MIVCYFSSLKIHSENLGLSQLKPVNALKRMANKYNQKIITTKSFIFNQKYKTYYFDLTYIMIYN